MSHAYSTLHVRMNYPCYIFQRSVLPMSCFFFFFNDTATTEIYTLSLHDALPICIGPTKISPRYARQALAAKEITWDQLLADDRSEEHTSELQSHLNLVCRLLLEKKK